MKLESIYVTSYPSQLLYTLSGHTNFSLQIQETIKPWARQSIRAFLCVNTYMEMIDSALCKWTLCGFCRLMGLEPSQKRSTLWTVDVYPNLNKQPWDVALIYLICRHQHYQWTWSRNQHSSSTGDRHGVCLPGACAHERTTQPSSSSTTFLWFFSNSINAFLTSSHAPKSNCFKTFIQ